MRAKLNQLCAGLTPMQIAIVTAAFIVSLLLALALAWYFRRYNRTGKWY